MKWKKESLFELPICYAVATVEVGGREHYVFATDDSGPCIAMDAETGARSTVWEGPGGTMSIIPVPGRDGEFLASQRFLPGFRALESRIVHVRKTADGWTVKPWMDIPYLHRFDILEKNGVRWLLGCILSGTEKPQADWSVPGGLVATPLDLSPCGSGVDGSSAECTIPPPAALRRIAGGMTHNHGYCRIVRNGQDAALVASDEGVFEVLPPSCREGEWQVTKILDVAASDAAVCDIDGDGVEEIATIEPFHGTQFVVYGLRDGAWREIYRHPVEMAFLHVVWGGRLRGVPCFLGGSRELGREFFLLRQEGDGIVAETIERGFGPSNVHVVSGANEDRVLVANRESAEAALFRVTD